MKTRFFRFVKHIVLTILILGAVGIPFGLYHGESFHYGDDPMMMNWDKDGPYVFYKNDSTLNLNIIKGNQSDGFFLERRDYSIRSEIPAFCYFPLDSTGFKFSINTDIKKPVNT